MKRSWIPMKSARHTGNPRPGVSVRSLVGVAAVGLWVVLAGTTAHAQAPRPFIPDITERSGLLMRFAGTPEVLPEDPYRDNFYNTRYADNGIVKHPNYFKTQGLYGLGLKDRDTESVYPYFYGMPGQSTVDASSRPGWRPGRIIQGLVHPFKPVGMYYSMGSYVPIYDLDPLVPGPGPYPFQFFFNWLHGG